MTSENNENQKPVQRGPNGQVDPTANVLALVEAAVKRINDLQDAATLRIESLRELDNKRIDELRISENRRLDEQAALREAYQEKLSLAESKRIDAIRAVDVNAVAVASERAAAQAQVLANQVSTSADALRTLVASTATTMAAQQSVSSQQFTERLTSLERSQYEGKGKSAFADPQLSDLVAEMKSLRESRSVTTGKGQGISAVWLVVTGAVGLIATLLSMGALIYTLNKSPNPQVIYEPAPVQTQPTQGAPIVVGTAPKK
jgi:hypothetical protein